MDYRELDDEYEINLKALLITICQQWRLIVACALACALAAVGFYVFKQHKVVVADPGEQFSVENVVAIDASMYGLAPTDGSIAGRYRTAIANYEDLIQQAASDESLLPAALAYKETVEEIRANISETRDYLENSLYYGATTADGITCKIQLLLEGLGRKSGNDLENAALIYKAYLMNNDLYVDLAKRWGTEPRYILEEVSFSAPQLYSSTDGDANMVATTLTQTDGEQEQYGRTLVLEVSVTAEGRERADELKDFLLEALERFRAENDYLADYVLSVEQVTYQVPFSRSVQEEQGNYMLSYAQMESLTAQYEAFLEDNAELIAAIEGAAEGATTEETQQAVAEAASSGISKRGLLKWALVGLFGGLAGCMAILAAYYVVRGVILSEDDINNVFRLRPLGTLRSARSSKHRTKLDRWLWECKEDASYRGMSEAERYGVLETKIFNYAPEGARSFLLVGTSEKDPLAEIAHKLGAGMKGCTFDTTSLLNGTKESLDALEASDGVVLVLNVANSRQQMIANDIETVHYYGKDIVGTIAVL